MQVEQDPSETDNETDILDLDMGFWDSIDDGETKGVDLGQDEHLVVEEVPMAQSVLGPSCIYLHEVGE